MSTRLERRIGRLRRKLVLALGVRVASVALLCGGALLGALALWLRSYGELEERWLYVGAALLALAALVAGAWAARRAPSRETLAAWLELRSASGGAVLSACAFGEELADEASARRTAAVEDGLYFAWGGSAARAALGIALLAAGALWPLSWSAVRTPEALLAELVARAAERFAQLEGNATLPAGEREALQQRLRELAERALADADPAALLRALDDLEERLAQHAERARAAAERALAEARPEQDAALPEELRSLAERALEQARTEAGARALAEALERARELSEAGTPEQRGAAAALAERLAEQAREAAIPGAGELAQGALLTPDQDAPGAPSAAELGGQRSFGGESESRRGSFAAQDSPEGAAARRSEGASGRAVFEEARAARLRRLSPSQRRAVESFFTGDRTGVGR
ncbi:MAG: hypothetical protein IPN34_24390 [Planctomycetes bacterium]|nr:hypothetical protein [Planctomycetota bacterium]